MKTFLATVAGLVIGGVMIWALEALGHQLFPLPFELDPQDPKYLEDLKNLMFKIPVESMIAIIVAHIVGVFTGLCVAKVIQKDSAVPVYIIGGLFLFSTGINLMVIPHPVWFSVTDIAGVLIVSLLFIRSVNKN